MLLVIAGGLVVLAWVERSPLLGAITIAYAASASLGVFHDAVKLPFQRGVGDYNTPDNSTVNVLLPGLVLIISAAIAFIVDLRKQ